MRYTPQRIVRGGLRRLVGPRPEPAMGWPEPDLSEPGTRELAEAVSSVPVWYHTIDFGRGVWSRGRSPGLSVWQFDRFGLDLSGRTVLDIGAFDGAFSFEAERRGAERVVALDHFVWFLDLEAHMAYWQECQDKGVVPLSYDQVPGHWDPVGMPGRKGFDTARRLLNSRVEPVVGDFMEMDLDEFGTFDVVLFLGVLYHLEDPLRAMRRVASLTREVAIIETAGIHVPALPDNELFEFYEANELNHDVSNWWAPNLPALHGICRASGFSKVETIQGPPTGDRPPLQRIRLTVRAVK